MNETPWPETTIFLGAGATAKLGLPSTAESGKVFSILGKIDGLPSSGTLRKRISDTGCFKGVEDELCDLLCWLGDDLNSELGEFSAQEEAALARQFPDLDEKERRAQAIFLREQYDWRCLKRVIQVCPGNHDQYDSFQNNLLNLLDLHIQANKGFIVSSKESGENLKDSFIPAYRLRFARQMMLLLSIIMYMTAWKQAVQNKPNLKPYIQFFDILAELMGEEGRRFSKKFKTNDRNFYLFSCAFISTNYDPGLMWLLMNSHEKANRKPPRVGDPPVPMKLFLDFECMTSGRHGKNTSIWHSVNESVTQRLNDPEHQCDRRFRIGKFYLPHGCFAWRDCPNCGHVTSFQPGKWSPYSPDIYPPTIIKGINPELSAFATKKEKEAYKAGQYDAVQCSYCGQMTYMRDTPLILQTSFKGAHPFYIEGIQTDMRVCLENTRHIVLLGYSLPPDDIIYKSMLAARKNRGKSIYCSVVVGHKGEKRWISGSELKEYLQKYKHFNSYGGPTIEIAVGIFGEENVRAFTGGIPAVFGEPVQRQKILELLYPTDVGVECFFDGGVKRGKTGSSV